MMRKLAENMALQEMQHKISFFPRPTFPFSSAFSLIPFFLDNIPSSPFLLYGKGAKRNGKRDSTIFGTKVNHIPGESFPTRSRSSLLLFILILFIYFSKIQVELEIQGNGHREAAENANSKEEGQMERLHYNQVQQFLFLNGSSLKGSRQGLGYKLERFFEPILPNRPVAKSSGRRRT